MGTPVSHTYRITPKLSFEQKTRLVIGSFIKFQILWLTESRDGHGDGCIMSLFRTLPKKATNATKLVILPVGEQVTHTPGGYKYGHQVVDERIINPLSYPLNPEP
jgi:hypothetical protein